MLSSLLSTGRFQEQIRVSQSK